MHAACFIATFTLVIICICVGLCEVREFIFSRFLGELSHSVHRVLSSLGWKTFLESSSMMPHSEWGSALNLDFGAQEHVQMSDFERSRFFI